MSRLTINILIGICCLIIGFFIGTAYIFPISISDEIDIVDCVNIVVTVFVGLYIAHTLEKQVQDHRVEKDIIIERINQIETHLEELEKIEADENVRYTFVINRVSKVREKKNRIIKQLRPRLNKSQTKSLDEIEQRIKPLFSTLKNLLTDTPIKPSPNPDIVMKNGKLKYSDNRIAEVVSVLLDINDGLLELKLFINTL